MKVVTIEFTSRQMEIVEILKKHEPITAEQIAEMLGITKGAIRSDLAVLVMTGYIDAKPKVGYFLGNQIKGGISKNRLNQLKVKDIQSLPVVVQETTTVHDAVITLFLEDVGFLIVVDEEGHLQGVVSRKDLLKVTLGNSQASTMPVNLVMTRQPKIITISEDESVTEAARKIVRFQVDGLPVLKSTNNQSEQSKQLVVGRISKTNMTKLLLEIATEV